MFKLNEYFVGIIKDVMVLGYLNFFIFVIICGNIVFEFVVENVNSNLFFSIFNKWKMLMLVYLVISFSIINIKKIIVL